MLSGKEFIGDNNNDRHDPTNTTQHHDTIGDRK